MTDDNRRASRERMVAHACRRMWQRFGRVLCPADYAALCAQAAAAPVTSRLRTGHLGRSFVPVTFDALTVIAIWDFEHACIVTFVPALPAAVRGAA